MASWSERLAREEAAVRGEVAALQEELDRVHKRLNDAEERLSRLAITRETMESLSGDDTDELDEPAPSTSDGPTGQGSEALRKDAGAAGVPEASQQPSGPLEWEEGRRRMVSLLATAGRAMKVKDLARAIGEDVSTAARVETTRGRLKRLATEGHVVEGPIGWFAITAGNASATAEDASG